MPIDALVLDTQGAELLVLKGATAVLRQVKFVKVEAADFKKSYKGGATAAAIEEYLKDFSLLCVGRSVFARHPRGGNYYDLLFKKSAE